MIHKNNIFISYKSDDEYYAKSIVKSIEQLGIKCWISSRDISDGGAFNREIKNAIAESHALLLILSKKSDESEEVERELALATQEEKLIIPVNIDNCKPENLMYWLSRIQWISFSEAGNFDEIAQRVLNRLGKVIIKPASLKNTFLVNISRFIPLYFGNKPIDPDNNVKIAKNVNEKLGKISLHINTDGFAVIAAHQSLTYSNAIELLLDRRKFHHELLDLRASLPDFFDKENTVPVNNPLFKTGTPCIEYIMSVHHIFDASCLKECEILSICEPSFAGITDDPTQEPISAKDAAFSIANLNPSRALSVINTVASKHNTFYVSWSNVLLIDSSNPSPDFRTLENLQIDLQKLWFQIYAYDSFIDNCILTPGDYDLPAVKQEIMKLKIAYLKFVKINPTGAGHINRLKENLINTSKISEIYNSLEEKFKYL